MILFLAKFKQSNIVQFFQNVFSNVSLKKAVEELKELDYLSIELKELQQELKRVEQNFQAAEGDYIEVASMELELIRQKYSITLRRIKVLQGLPVNSDGHVTMPWYEEKTDEENSDNIVDIENGVELVA